MKRSLPAMSSSMPLIAASLAVFLAGWCCHASAAEPRAEFSPEQFAAAKRHPDFATLVAAKTIVVGESRVRIRGADKDFPPVYHLTMTVTPSEVITGDAESGDPLRVRFKRRSEVEPEFADVPYLVAVGSEEDRRSLRLLRPIKRRLYEIARIATAYREEQELRNTALARKNPEMHPLFNQLDDAGHLALLQFPRKVDAWVGLDEKTNLVEHYNVTVAASLRGDLKPGLIRRLFFTAGAPGFREGSTLLAIVEIRDGVPVVTRTIRADEESVRVAAAAAETDPAELISKAGLRPAGE